jgi:hypothetical protein
MNDDGIQTKRRDRLWIDRDYAMFDYMFSSSPISLFPLGIHLNDQLLGDLL